MINNQIVKTSGEIYARGEVMKYGKPAIKIGALVEAPGLYPDCNAHDNLMYKCVSMGIYSKAYVDGLLARVELQNTGKKKVKQFSLGMKQRLSIALALVNEPDLLILDEPINGMDPQGIRDIREMLVSVNREMGVTILISSHILDELAKFATTYGIIKDGLVLREFTREQLENENRSGIEVESPQIEAIENLLREEMHISDMQRTAEGSLLIRDGVERYQDISRLLFDKGIYVSQFSVRRESLENYFMKMTGGGRI